MEGRYEKSNAERLVASYKREINRQKEAIRKNFYDMDLQNANVKDDFEDIVEDMVRNCDQLISKIEEYVFH